MDEARPAARIQNVNLDRPLIAQVLNETINCETADWNAVVNESVKIWLR